MYSLALLAVIIISIAVIGGPLSFLFSLLRNLKGFLEITRIIFVFLFGLPAMTIAIFLITRWISIGATLMGLFGAASSGLGMYRTIKQIQEKRKPTN